MLEYSVFVALALSLVVRETITSVTTPLSTNVDFEADCSCYSSFSLACLLMFAQPCLLN